MTLPIDTISYDKAKTYPEFYGYELRTHPPTSLLVHTTNNGSATPLDQELNYLYTSRRASAHFLVSKAGALYQFLDPRAYAAWHAGQALSAFVNQRSIGIEMHVSVGERPTAPQIEALTLLTRAMMREFGIIPAMVETHRFAARPVGRKSDPEGWSDAQFYAWRATLTKRTYRLRTDQAALSSNDLRVAQLAPSVDNWHIFREGELVEVDDVTGGMAHDASGVGFVPLAVLEVV